VLHVSSRFDGVVYQVSSGGEVSVYVEGMGVATGIAFDSKETCTSATARDDIQDQSGTPDLRFATLEASISAYHLCFGPEDMLFVTGPTTSSYDAVQRITPAGEVDVFYRGLGRRREWTSTKRATCTWPDRGRAQGHRAHHAGARGVARLKRAEHRGAGVHAGAKMIVVTTSSAFRVAAGIEGLKRV